jgi:hypothetical protein
MNSFVDVILNKHAEAMQAYRDIENRVRSETELPVEFAKQVGAKINESGKEYQSTIKDMPVGEALLKTIEAGGKGLVEGYVGGGGELEKLIKGIGAVINTPEGKSKLDALLQEFEADSSRFNPDTERAEKMVSKVAGKSPEGFGFVEGGTQLLGPVGILHAGSKAVKGAAKGIKKMTKANK